jgi:hypothetical protein
MGRGGTNSLWSSGITGSVTCSVVAAANNAILLAFLLMLSVVDLIAIATIMLLLPAHIIPQLGLL